ncbi:protein SCAI-like [Saccoglossus kowalevskii]
MTDREDAENGDRTGKRENPHKYLLYKPTFGQLFTFLSAGFKELPPNAALLIYLSADGSSGSERPEDEGAYDYGGVVTNNRREPGEPLQMKRSHLLKEMHCLHPGDLYPFSRKPLFLVVDSTNSVVFKNVPNLFGQPLVCLMSPTQLPKNLQDQNTKGNLFTLFMYSPLTAFCHVCDIGDIPVALWEKCQKHVTMVTQETATLISKSRSLDHTYMQFYGDEFLRLLMLRFVFCYVTLKYHRGFKDDTYYPQSHPEMKGCDILENVNLHKWILELASILDVRALFLEVSELE